MRKKSATRTLTLSLSREVIVTKEMCFNEYFVHFLFLCLSFRLIYNLHDQWIELVICP